mgnify:CR=1 FL=1
MLQHNQFEGVISLFTSPMQATGEDSPFPFLLCVDASGCSFVGYVGPSAQRDRYEFMIQLEKAGDLSSARVRCSSGLTQLLGSTGMELLQKRMAAADSLHTFLVELDNLIVCASP